MWGQIRNESSIVSLFDLWSLEKTLLDYVKYSKALIWRIAALIVGASGDHETQIDITHRFT